MRTLRRYLLVSVITLLAGMGFYSGWRLLRINQRAKEFLAGKGILAEQVDVGFGTIHLKGIKAPIYGDGTLWVKDAKIGYSLWGLLRCGIGSCVREFSVSDPELTFDVGKLTDLPVPDPGRQTGRTQSIPDLLSQPIKRINPINRLNRLILSGGKISLKNSSGEAEIARKIRGWVASEDNGRINLYLGAQLLSKKGNAKVHGFWNGQPIKQINPILAGGAQYDLKVEAESVDLSDDALKIFCTNVFPESGKMDLSLRFQSRLQSAPQSGIPTKVGGSRKSGDSSLSGKIEIKNAALRLAGLNSKVESLDLNGEIKDDSIIIHKGKGLIGGVDFRLTGQIGLIYPPKLSLKLETPYLQIKDLAKMVMPGQPIEQINQPIKRIKPITSAELSRHRLNRLNRLINRASGGGSLLVNIEGPPDSLRLTGVFDKGVVSYNGERIDDLKLCFTVAESVLTIQSISGRLGEAILKGKGKVGHRINPMTNADNKQLELRFDIADADYERIGRLLERKELGGKGNLNIYVNGDIRAPRWQVRYKSDQLVLGGHDLGSQTGSLRYDGKRLRFHSSWKGGEMSESFLCPFEKVGLRINKLLFGGFGEKIKGKVRIEGNLSSVETSGELEVGSYGRFHLNGHLMADNNRLNRLTHTPKFKGSIFSDSLKVGDSILALNTKISTDKERLRFDFEAADSVQHPVEKIKGKLLEGSLLVNDPSLSNRLNPFNRLTDIWQMGGIRGNLNGTVDLDGTLGKPQAVGELVLEHGQIGNLDSLDAGLSFHWGKESLLIKDLILRRGSDVLLSLKGAWGKDDKIIKAEAQRIGASSFLSLFWSNHEKIKGELSYAVLFFEEKGSPKFKADFLLTDGEVLDIPFDKVEGTLKGDPGWIQIANINFEKQGQYKGLAEGEIPTFEGEEKELDIKLKVKGDILSLLPDLTDKVEDASGRGEINLHIGGGWKAPVIGEAQVGFVKGEIAPRFLADAQHSLKRIKGLKGKIALQKGSRFLKIEELSGNIGGGRFVIENREQMEFDAQRAEPLIIEDLGLSLGILNIRTEKGGLELNIPGLMRPKERGRLELIGKPGEDGLYIAGPNDSPLVRGICRVSNIEFTYPPLKSKSKASPSKRSFSNLLGSVNWDLKVITQKDVRYFREQEFGVTDLASTDVKIKEEGWLKFQGSVAKKTFHVAGRMESEQGRIVYLDTEFQVEEMGFELDTKIDPRPLLWGSAKTTVYCDTTNVPTDIFLRLYAIDQETKARTERGRWGEVKLELASSDPSDDTPGKILAKLGYSLDNYNQKVAVVLTTGIERLLFQRLVRPFEREIRKGLGLDVFYLRPSLVRNLLNRDELLLEDQARLSYLAFLRGTKLTMGEYLLDNWFLFYTGELRTEKDSYQKAMLGIIHRLGLEFRINTTSIELEYQYDDVLRSRDKQFRIKHYFPL